MDLKEKLRNLSVLDIATAKFAALLVGIAIGSFMSASVSGYELWIAILGIIIGLKPLHSTCLKK